jgi:hypothetical protein
MFSLTLALFAVIFAVAVLATLEGARRALTGARVNREMRAYAGLPAVTGPGAQATVVQPVLASAKRAS